MAFTTPVDREFAVLPRGFIRDRVILANFRAGLRLRTNPETGQPFTEEQIQRATQPGTRWYNEAQAIDDLGQSDQRKALFLADQLRIERSSTKWLREFHGEMWGETPLAATGGTGPVTVSGVPGTPVVGSTTLGDPAAYKARDGAGNSYQVLVGANIEPGGTVQVNMAALGTGAQTNPLAGDVLTWTLRDPNMSATATVAVDFSGGTDPETDAEFASRLIGIRRHKQGAGNDSQTRGWARRASNAIEDAYVYACAFHAGSVLIAATQKRGVAVGPLARILGAGTLAQLIAYMTPPGSPVYPSPPFVLCTATQSEPTNLVIRLEQSRGSASGWADVLPFPSYHATTPTVTSVTSNSDFEITCPGDATLPGQLALATLSGIDAPQIMIWNQSRSEFVRQSVSSIEDQGSNVYRVQCTPVPGFSVAAGQVVCPDMALRGVVSSTLQQYFDALGPGELFDLDEDPRGGRCVRFPRAGEERPYRVGPLVATRVTDALGGAAEAVLASISQTEPTYPPDITQGPNQLTLGKAGVYAL